MYNNEIKGELLTIDKATKEIDKQFIAIKTAIHTLDKMGYNMDEIYKQIDFLGIELYKTKNILKDKDYGLNTSDKLYRVISGMKNDLDSEEELTDKEQKLIENTLDSVYDKFEDIMQD